MLAEGFLRMLRYREERKFHRSQTQGHGSDPVDRRPSEPDSTDQDADSESAEEGPYQEEPDPKQCQGLKLPPQVPEGVLIPGSFPLPTLDPDFALYLEDCSLLEQYPDLQVADSGPITQNPLRTIISHDLEVPDHLESTSTQGAVTSIPDQGYLDMGANTNMSLDLPGSGLGPMSNSVLNGFLEKQLEEVYMQHLTDNLARCNSHLGNSLLHGLVPPPKPSSQARGPDSLEASLDVVPGGDKRISSLITQNLVPCSSNFSSPVLRISEAE